MFRLLVAICFCTMRSGVGAKHLSTTELLIQKIETLAQKVDELSQDNIQLRLAILNESKHGDNTPHRRSTVNSTSDGPNHTLMPDGYTKIKFGRNCGGMLAEDVTWIILCGISILSMQAGFAFVEIGSVQTTNVVSIMMKNLCDLCVGAFVFWAFGWGISQGHSFHGLFGTSQFVGYGVGDHARWFFLFSFAATAATIDSGAIAGRFSFICYLLISAQVTMWTFPVVSHWVWASGGLLSKYGYIDFAGSSAVHVVGAVSGYCSAWWVGPRHGMYSRSGNSSTSHTLYRNETTTNPGDRLSEKVPAS
jgi:hypothetical protein